MSVNRRAGFTVVELTVSLALFAAVMGAAGRLLLTEQRRYRELGQRADLSDNLRAAVQILSGDLWGLDARDGDILALGSDSLRIRAERVFTVVCQAETGSLVLRKARTYGIRDFAAGDSLLVYAESDTLWRAGAVTSPPASASCPDSTPGERIGVELFGALPGPGSPVRGYEVVTYRSYRGADGAYYLGVRDAGGLQPVAGPLAPSGLLLSFLDSAGAPTSIPSMVAAIRIRVRAVSAEPVTRGGRTALLVDTAVSWVTLRNNRHD